MVFEEMGQKKGLIIISIILFILLFIVAFFIKGINGIFAVLKFFFWLIIITSIIGLIIYGVVWIFKKHPVDMVNVHKKKIIQACRMNSLPFQQNLALIGDTAFSYRVIGKIIGFCEIKAQPQKEVVEKEINADLPFKKKEFKIITKWKTFIFVSFRKHWYSSINVCAVLKEDIKDINQPIVLLMGTTFSPPIYRIYFLSKYFSYSNLTDEVVKDNIYRYTMEENLKELVNIVQEAINISPRFKKEQEKSNIQSIPTEIPMKK